MLVLDDCGNRKDGHATAHVARQYIGSPGKTSFSAVDVTHTIHYLLKMLENMQQLDSERANADGSGEVEEG